MFLSLRYFLALCTLFFLISNVHSEKNDDDYKEVLGSVFYPVTFQWQLNKCKQLNLPFEYRSAKVHAKKPLGKPTVIRNIPGLSACFFNALSYAITGTTRYGQILRSNVLDFMEASELFFDEERISIMKIYPSMFAGSEEIFGAAAYLQTSIYVYTNEDWQFHSKDMYDGERIEEPSIYLSHTGLEETGHFNYVIDIESDDKSPHISEFRPVLGSWQMEKTKELFESEAVTQVLFDTEISKPLHNKSVQAMEDIPKDGNSFFYSLSHCITGTIDHAAKLRELLVNYMEKSPTLKKVINDENELNQRLQYVSNDLVSVNGHELYAAAELLNTSIYIYNTDNQEWDFVSKDGPNGEESSENCIYLKHFYTSMNMFTVVNDVSE